MIPLYTLPAVELVFGLHFLVTGALIWPWWCSLIGFGLWGSAIVLGSVLSVPNRPLPSGPFAVGTMKYHLVDEHRKEIYSHDPEDPRELMVQVWYPSDQHARGARAPWIDGTEKFSAFALDIIHYPGFLMNHMDLAKSHSIQDAPLSAHQQINPLILFSHGFTGFREQNIAQMEELASHGYVVVAPSHTCWSLATVLSDGRLILPNPDSMPQNPEPHVFKESFNQVIRQWEGDLHFVLNHFERMNDGELCGLFSGRLDLERVGVMGHSIGGGAALEFSWSDHRCKALLAMDLWSEPVSDEVIEKSIDVPTLLMYSETWNSSIDLATTYQRSAKMLSNIQAPSYQMTIAGTRHQDLTTMNFLAPSMARLLRFRGSVDPLRVMNIVNSYALTFFNKHFQIRDSTLLDCGSPMFPEVSFAAPMF